MTEAERLEWNKTHPSLQLLPPEEGYVDQRSKARREADLGGPRPDQSREAFHKYAPILGEMVKVAIKEGAARVRSADCGLSTKTLVSRLRDVRDAIGRFGYRAPEIPDVNLREFSFAERGPFVYLTRKFRTNVSLSSHVVSSPSGQRQPAKFADVIPYTPETLQVLRYLSVHALATGGLMVDVGEGASEARTAVRAIFPTGEDFCEWAEVELGKHVCETVSPGASDLSNPGERSSRE